MRLFPHVLVRVGGGPIQNLEKLNVDETLTTIHEIQSLKKRCSVLKNNISNILYNVIPLTKDSKTQNELLNFKRDIFNDKNITRERTDSIQTHLPEKSNIDLEEYIKINDRIKNLILKGEQSYTNEMIDIRQNLRKLAMNDNLQKGLLLSSQSLLKRTKNYLNKDMQSLKKEDLKTEQSLIKYITRMYAKTSPFSTFTNLLIAKTAKVNGSSKSKKSILYVEGNSKPEVISHVRLNNHLLKYLWGLLLKNPQIFKLLLLRPNPSIKDNDDHYLFLVNSNNVESFQRLSSNPVLEVFHYLPSQKKEGIVYKDLVDTIVEKEYLDASREEIEAYLNQLIEFGFLEYNLGVSGIDPDWDKKLCDKLTPLSKEYPLVDELIHTLICIRDIADQYAKSNLNSRKEILEDAYQQFRSICMKLHEAAGLPENERKTLEELRAEKKKINDKEAPVEDDDLKNSEDKKDKADTAFKHQISTYFNFKPEQIFYEDTTFNITPQMDQDEIKDLMSTLNHLLQKMDRFDYTKDQKDQMYPYFLEIYGGKKSIDLLTMYEDYYRDIRKPEEKRLEKTKKERWKKKEEAQKDKKPGDKEINKNGEEIINKIYERFQLKNIPKIRERKAKNENWLNRFKEIIQNSTDQESDLIHLSLEQIEKTDRSLNSEIQNHGHAISSYGCFIQFFKNDSNQKIMGVLNNSFPGFGKMMSRFLHVFSDTITSDLREWNLSVNKYSILAEDCDASYFNANLHPPLMPYEIWMPNGHNTLLAGQQIPVTDIEVRINEKQQQLQLFHKPTGKNLYIFNLGFQGIKGRSPLFQLLTIFSLTKSLSCYSIMNTVNTIWQTQRTEDSKKIQIMTVPRIVYEDRIILQRKSWLVPKSLLPYKKQNESDMSYFLRINEWKIDKGMPDEIFLFVNTDRFLENTEPEAAKKLGRDDYKPQYISFKNPLLIRLFEKLLYKVPKTLKIEEMLPNSQQLVNIHNKQYVTEFAVQWYDDLEKK